MREHSIAQAEVNLNYTMTEMMQEHRSIAFASSEQTSEEFSLHFELLQDSTTEGSTALQHVEHRKLFRMTFYVGNILLEEGNKSFELDKISGIVHEQQFAMQDDWNEERCIRSYATLQWNMTNPWKAMPKVEQKP